MAQYTKSHLSLPAQLALLENRGLIVQDDAAAAACLHRNGYYRLSAYWYPFREIVSNQRTDTFLDGSHFEDAVALYIFDKKFKLHLLDALERVEIAVRVEMALLLGARDKFALSNPNIFHPNFVTHTDMNGETRFQKWTRKYQSAVGRSTEEFVKHYHQKYGRNSPMPVWIAVELWDFGMLSSLFSGLRINDRQAISQRFDVSNWDLMESWLWCLNYVRNVIAHHGRLWNVNLSSNPKLPRRGLLPQLDHLRSLPLVNTRIYSVCCILCHFSRVINPQSSWPQQLVTLLNNFPVMPYANIQAMGFPANWQNETLWK